MFPPRTKNGGVSFCGSAIRVGSYGASSGANMAKITNSPMTAIGKIGIFRAARQAL